MPEAGWYEDPADPSRVRWWDGDGWTSRLAPSPSDGSVDPDGAEDARPRGLPTWARVLGLVVVGVVAAAGTFFGARALSDDDGGDDVAAHDTSAQDGAGPGDATTAPPPPRSDEELLVGPAEPAFVAVLASVPQAELDGAGVAQRARDLAALDARVLDTDDYTTDSRPEPLTPQLWVLWTGPHADEAAADAFCAGPAAAAGVTGCFALRVLPRS